MGFPMSKLDRVNQEHHYRRSQIMERCDDPGACCGVPHGYPIIQRKIAPIMNAAPLTRDYERANKPAVLKRALPKPKPRAEPKTKAEPKPKAEPKFKAPPAGVNAPPG